MANLHSADPKGILNHETIYERGHVMQRPGGANHLPRREAKRTVVPSVGGYHRTYLSCYLQCCKDHWSFDQFVDHMTSARSSSGRWDYSHWSDFLCMCMCAHSDRFTLIVLYHVIVNGLNSNCCPLVCTQIPRPSIIRSRR